MLAGGEQCGAHLEPAHRQEIPVADLDEGARNAVTLPANHHHIGLQ